MAHQEQIERSIQRLKESAISERNKELILKFTDFCFSSDLNPITISKYLCYLPRMARILGVDFDKVTRDDMVRMMAEVKRLGLAHGTTRDYKKIIKRFYRWLLGNDEFYPPQVCWIKCEHKSANKILPEDLLSEEDVRKMVEKANHMRDKALVSMLYEGGFRIGEMRAMRIRHVEFERQYVRLTVPQEGKTGVRRVLLVNSTPYIANWMAHHPKRSDPNAFVWVCIGNMNHGKKMSYNTVRKVLVELAEKAKVRKRVNPHSFRHARATHLASELTESQMKQYLGWTQGSKMAAVYVHMSGRDVDSSILEMHGLKTPEEDKRNNQMELKTCQVCGKTNEFEARICCRCGRALSIKDAMEQEERDERKVSGYLDARPKIKEDMMAYLKNAFLEEMRKELDLTRLKTELLKELKNDLIKNLRCPESVMDKIRVAAKAV